MRTCKLGHRYDPEKRPGYKGECPTCHCERRSRARSTKESRARALVVAQLWRATPRGKALRKRQNGRRVFIGGRYFGFAGEAEQAQAIKLAVLPKLDAFKDTQREERVAQKETLDTDVPR